MIIIELDGKQVIRIDGETTLGTLILTEQGLGFRIPRGKKDSRFIPWDKMFSVYELLNNIPGFLSEKEL